MILASYMLLEGLYKVTHDICIRSVILSKLCAVCPQSLQGSLSSITLVYSIVGGACVVAEEIISLS